MFIMRIAYCLALLCVVASVTRGVARDVALDDTAACAGDACDSMPLYSGAAYAFDVAKCANYTDCGPCVDDTGCQWCASSQKCGAFGAACDGGACGLTPGSNGTASDGACWYVCHCSESTYPCAKSIVGELLLIVFYGALLGLGAKLISDGSEILLELFPAWGTVIGAVLLPVLGAVPDSAIILFSGFGPHAQENLAVGVGTLAGSTILLLTGAWAGSAMAARCDFNVFGEPQDNVCSKLTVATMRTSGVGVDEDTPTNAKIMLITAINYLIVQVVAFAHLSDPDGEEARKVERPATLVGFISCMVCLVGYCVYQVMVPNFAQKRVQARLQASEEKGRRLKALNILRRLPGLATHAAGAYGISEEEQREAAVLSIAMRWRRKALRIREAKTKAQNASARRGSERTPLLINNDESIRDMASIEQAPVQHSSLADADGEEGEEHSFRRELIKSFVLTVVGTALVTVFSDPLVDLLSDFSKNINVPAFYVSFLLTPLASNASELVSSFIFAAKKRVENSSLTYSQIYGACAMNNTMCLGIFYALIYFSDGTLAWEFSAEVVAILFVTLCVGILGASRRNFNVYYFIPVTLLYPLSIALVWMLKTPSIGINWQ